MKSTACPTSIPRLQHGWVHVNASLLDELIARDSPGRRHPTHRMRPVPGRPPASVLGPNCRVPYFTPRGQLQMAQVPRREQ